MDMMNTKLSSTTNGNNSNHQLLLKTWINIWSLFNTIIATVVSLFVIIYVIIIYILKKNSKKSFHVSLVLTSNTSLTIICCSITLGLMALASIGGDHSITFLRQISFWNCHFRGFLVYILITSLFISYVLQAGYRYFRIVYHKQQYFRTISTFLYYILAQWILSLILTLPILIVNKNHSSLIIYIPEYFNCVIPFTNIRGVLFVTVIVFISPLCILCLIYSQIIIHLRRKKRESVSTLKLRRQNKRDASVIKRIYTIIIVLGTLCLPSVLFFIRFLITGELYWAAYHICWTAASLSLVFISLSSLYVTPQIYNKIRVICGCSTPRQRRCTVSYSINIIVEKERKIESILLENITISDPNILRSVR